MASDIPTPRPRRIALRATLAVMLAIVTLGILALLVAGRPYWREQQIQRRVKQLGGEARATKHAYLPLSSTIDIELSNAAVSDRDMALFGSAPGLVTMDLKNTSVSDAGVALFVRAAQEGKIRSLHLVGNPLTDAAVCELATLPRLQHLYLDHTQIAGAELGRLTALPKLRWLSLKGISLSADELAELARLTQVKLLMLNEAQIEEAGAEHLGGFASLKLGGTNITDAGIERLAKQSVAVSLGLERTAVTARALDALRTMPKLKHLDVAFTSIGDADLAHLIGAPQLQSIRLTGCPITDAATDSLAQLSLKSLILERTAITDQGVMNLAKCPTLKEIYVGDTSVTDEGLNAFRAQRPDVKIER